MKEGSEGDVTSKDVPTSRDADSTVCNGSTQQRMGTANTTGTTLANALLGITLEVGRSHIHSTNSPKGGKNDHHNNRDKVFVCTVCNRCFGYKHVLQNHERTHTGEKPFECKECHKRFTRDHHLKTHMRLHTGEKPYHCSHCERQFVQVANLRRHLRVHTGERPYACTLCSSRFSDSNQLKAHLLIHEGIKPFECHLCLGRFRRRHHLVHHKCPKDEANAGKPRRGRRPRAYDQLPGLPPSLQQLSEQPKPIALTSVITRGSPPQPLPLALGPPPPPPPVAHARNHAMHLPNGHFHEGDVQTGPLDMSVTRHSVIVPRGFVDGVLDLSNNSRSDSEAEPIEEEVDEAELDLDSDSEEERTWTGDIIRGPGNGDIIHVPGNGDVIHAQGNGKHFEPEADDLRLITS